MIAVETSTLLTSIGSQFLGYRLDNCFVVMQYEALVTEATVSYFLEWKKLISLFVELTKSFTSKIFVLRFLILLTVLILVKISLILYGPLFSKD